MTTYRFKAGSTVTDTIELKAYDEIEGESAMSSIIKGNGVDPVIYGVDLPGIKISNIQIHGGADPTGARNKNTGIALPGAEALVVSNTVIAGCGGYAVGLGGRGPVNVVIDNTHMIYIAGDGIDGKNSGGVSTGSVVNSSVTAWGLAQASDGDQIDKAALDIRGKWHISGFRAKSGGERDYGIRFREGTTQGKHGPGGHMSQATNLYFEDVGTGVHVSASNVQLSQVITNNCDTGLKVLDEGLVVTGFTAIDCDTPVESRTSSAIGTTPVRTTIVGGQFINCGPVVSKHDTKVNLYGVQL